MLSSRVSHFGRLGILIARYVIGHHPSFGKTKPLLSGFPHPQSSYTLEVVRTSNRYILATWVGADLSYSLYVVIILVNIALHIGFIHFSAQRQTMTGTSTCIGMIQRAPGLRVNPIRSKMQLYVYTTVYRAASANDTIYHSFSQPQLRPAW